MGSDHGSRRVSNAAVAVGLAMGLTMLLAGCASSESQSSSSSSSSLVFGIESTAADAEPFQFVQQFQFRADSGSSAFADPEFVQQFFEFLQQFVAELQL